MNVTINQVIGSASLEMTGVEKAKTNLTISYEYLNVLATKEPIMFSGKVLKWNKYTIK